jgi:hypothetical protein
MSELAKKLADAKAAKAEEVKEQKFRIKSHSHRGFQFGNGFIRPDIMKVVTPKTQE